MPITRKTLAALTWGVAFEESGFKVFKTEALGDDFAIIHDWRAHRPATRCRIYYVAYGTKFREPGEAIQHYNEEEELRRRRAAAGAEPAGV